MAKLCQIVAIEKGVKNRVYGEVTETHKLCQKPELFNGFVRTYEKKDQDGEDVPQERKKVQLVATAVIKDATSKLTELFDVTAQKDWANCVARANVTLENGRVILENAPATYLMFLEKQLADLRTFVDRIPVLDEAEDWELDQNAGVYKTPSTVTTRTKKVPKPIVLYPATDKHPAQTQLITEDITVGSYQLVKYSGALPAPEKEKLLGKIEALAKAVKFAREQANSAEAPKVDVTREMFDYLLG